MTIKLEGKVVELFVKLDSNMYRKYLIYERVKSVLYDENYKSLYVDLTASILFCNYLEKKLKGWMFIINPYNTCVSNKT